MKKAFEEEKSISFPDAAKSGARPVLAMHIGFPDVEVFGITKRNADTA